MAARRSPHATVNATARRLLALPRARVPQRPARTLSGLRTNAPELDFAHGELLVVRVLGGLELRKLLLLEHVQQRGLARIVEAQEEDLGHLFAHAELLPCTVLILHGTPPEVDAASSTLSTARRSQPPPLPEPPPHHTDLPGPRLPAPCLLPRYFPFCELVDEAFYCELHLRLAQKYIQIFSFERT